MLADKITNFLYEKNIITDDDKEIVKFGLESIAGNLLGLVLTLSIGIIFKHFADALLLWVMLFPLRKTVGGYHASTKIGCFFTSTALLLLAFGLFTTFDNKIMIYELCSFVASVVIWCLAPVENMTKWLDSTEYKVYKMRSRMILIIEEIILIISLFFNWMSIVRSVGMAFFVASVSVILGKMSMRQGGREQENKYI